MRRELIWVVVVIFLAIGAAVYISTGKDFGSVGENAQAAVNVPFTRITEGMQADIVERVNYLITSPEQFKQLWGVVKAAGSPPAINFSTEAIIAVFAGEKPTAGHDIAVSKIEDAGNMRVVTISLTEPGPDCITVQVVTKPYEILKVPATSLTFTHKDTITTANCSE